MEEGFPGESTEVSSCPGLEETSHETARGKLEDSKRRKEEAGISDLNHDTVFSVKACETIFYS